MSIYKHRSYFNYFFISKLTSLENKKFWSETIAQASTLPTLIDAVPLLNDTGSFECSVSRLFRCDPR